MKLVISESRGLRGQVRVPGDKSISHRALLLGAIAQGETRVRGFLPAADCLATLACVRALGIEVDALNATTLVVHGRGLHGLREPEEVLDCGGSGTTMRLLMGLLAGQSFTSVLTGNASLRRRPMERVAVPLRRMGAEVRTTEGCPPLVIRGGRLRGVEYALPVASAQVKSAILLAGLYAEGETVVREPGPARDHTERMLRAMGAAVQVRGPLITLLPDPQPLSPLDITIPGDFSSAAFLLVAALLVLGSEVAIQGVGVNPTRTGLLEVLRRMGAEVVVEGGGEVNGASGEPVGDLVVRTSELAGVEVGGQIIPRMIDELPILAVAATQARGLTVVRDAAELRVKETDRIGATVAELRKLGAQIEERPDGFVVQGPTLLRGTHVSSHGDHRLAMSLAVAGLIAQGETVIEGAECIGDSFPGFERVLRSLTA
ncbi:MAG: 3-phosphoshikimate 1-carboxyvinyltransferase [Anaerolineae bacterium]